MIIGYNLLTCLFGAFQGLNFGEIRGFVTVKYDNNWYVAWVLDTFIDTFEVKVCFLHPAGPSKSYKYPKLSEQALLPSSDVLTLVDPSIHKRGRVYYMTDKETNDVDHAMQLIYNCNNLDHTRNYNLHT